MCELLNLWHMKPTLYFFSWKRRSTNQVRLKAKRNLTQKNRKFKIECSYNAAILHELKNVCPFWSTLPQFNIGSKCRNSHCILESNNNKRSNPKTFCLSTYWNLFQPVNWFKTTKSLTVTTSWIWRNNTVIVEIINMMQLNNGLNSPWSLLPETIMLLLEFFWRHEILHSVQNILIWCFFVLCHND